MHLRPSHSCLAIVISFLTLASCGGDDPTYPEEEAALFNMVGEWDTSLAIGFALEGSGSSTEVLNCQGLGTTIITEDNDPQGSNNHKALTDLAMPGCGSGQFSWTAEVIAPKGPTSTLPVVVFSLLHPSSDFAADLNQRMVEVLLSGGSGWFLGGEAVVSRPGRMERSGKWYVAVGATISLSRLTQ